MKLRRCYDCGKTESKLNDDGCPECQGYCDELEFQATDDDGLPAQPKVLASEDDNETETSSNTTASNSSSLDVYEASATIVANAEGTRVGTSPKILASARGSFETNLPHTFDFQNLQSYPPLPVVASRISYLAQLVRSNLVIPDEAIRRLLESNADMRHLEFDFRDGKWYLKDSSTTSTSTEKSSTIPTLEHQDSTSSLGSPGSYKSSPSPYKEAPTIPGVATVSSEPLLTPSQVRNLKKKDRKARKRANTTTSVASTENNPTNTEKPAVKLDLPEPIVPTTKQGTAWNRVTSRNVTKKSKSLQKPSKYQTEVNATSYSTAKNNGENEPPRGDAVRVSYSMGGSKHDVKRLIPRAAIE